MKIYFYNKNNLKEIPKSRFGIDLKTLNSMIFENLEGESLTQEELKIKYIQENHYSKYNPETHVLSDKEYINPILESGVLREKTPTELKLENPELLEDGEYISGNEAITVPYAGNFLQRKWNKETHVWEEGATAEEIKAEYTRKIDEYKQLCMDAGFDWTDKTGKIHRQNYREKDENKINTVEVQILKAQLYRSTDPSFPVQTVDWGFSDEDVYTIDETEFMGLSSKATEHMQKCYRTEQYLKLQAPNHLIEYKDFENYYKSL